jgi:hypothetical protein
MLEKRQSLQPMVLGKLNIYMQKTENSPLSFNLYKNEFKVAQRSKCKTCKFENLEKMLEYIIISSSFLNKTSITQDVRARISLNSYLYLQ